jgi:hypothetical protein
MKRLTNESLMNLGQSKNFNFCSYNYKMKSTLSFAKHINHDCREPSRGKKNLSAFFAPKLRGCRLSFFESSFYSSGSLLCLILG